MGLNPTASNILTAPALSSMWRVPSPMTVSIGVRELPGGCSLTGLSLTPYRHTLPECLTGETLVWACEEV